MTIELNEKFKKNQGPNKAFEELKKLGNGEFFAYCDQGDIWKRDSCRKFRDKDVALVCSNIPIIDENGIKTY